MSLTDVSGRTTRLLGVLAALLAVLWLVVAPAARADDGDAPEYVGLTVSVDPVEDKAATVTVSGHAEAGRGLSVWVQRAVADCAPTVDGEHDIDGASPLAISDGGVDGTFEQAAAFTPPDDGDYRVCAFMYDVQSDVPLATAVATFTARAPVATLTASVAGDPIAGKPFTLTLTGTTEVDRHLAAFVVPGSEDCESTAGAASEDDDVVSVFAAPGASISKGGFSRSPKVTVPDAGDLRVCAYVSDGRWDLPEAVASADFTVSPAPTPTPEPTPEPTPDPTPDPTPQPTPDPTPQPEPTRTPAPTPTRQAMTAPTAAPVVQSQPIAAPPAKPAGPTYAATLLTGSGDQYDRLELRWSVDGDPAAEQLYVWDENPAAADGGNLVIADQVDDDEDYDLTLAGDVRDLKVLHHLGYRQFWWQIRTRTPGGQSLQSAVGTFRVVPSPLDESLVRVSPKLTLKHSSAHPGTVRLRIASSPRARVTIKVKHAGRVVSTKHYTEGVGALRGLEYPLSCTSPGTYSFEVRIRDPYGASVTRRGRWISSVSRCASLKAEERAKELARQRAAAEKRRRAEERERQRQEREQQQQQSSSSDSSGGGNCDPNYTGQCLTPGIGDYDCAGGSGNGPNYVEGTVTVVGTDVYGLDGYPHDGIGCNG